MRPASACRHRAGARDPLLEHPNAVPQLGRELEVLALDGLAQLRLQLEQPAAGVRCVAPAFPFARRHIALADVLAGAVQPPQQIAQMRVERHIALVAAEPAGVTEVAQRAAARRAAYAVGRGRNERAPPATFPERGQEAAERGLEHGAAGFHALLLRALFAQMQGHFGVVLHLREVDDRVALLAVIAEHQGIASTELTVVSRPSSSKSTRSARPASWRLCVTTTTAVSYSRARRKKISCNRSALA